MREHKFRAWDKKTKQMVEVVAIVYSDFQIESDCDNILGDPIVDEGIWINVGNECFIEEPRDFKDVELMQYTERKDKKVAEIYEGDILKDDYGRILLVEWWKCGFSFKAVTETNFVRAGDISQWFEDEEILPEIIGNIFENPELVKGANNEK